MHFGLLGFRACQNFTKLLIGLKELVELVIRQRAVLCFNGVSCIAKTQHLRSNLCRLTHLCKLTLLPTGR
jgi:hypothetical protein